jgi:ribose transport system permease protein
VLGGVLLGGGRGWVMSAAAGAFALELLFTLLAALDVIDAAWRETIQGVIIIAAVAVAARAWRAGRRPSRRARQPDPHAETSPPMPEPGTTTGEH